MRGTPEAVDALLAGRKEWSKMRSFEEVTDIVEKAAGDPNRIKAGFNRLIQNPKKFRGFSDVEKDAIRQAAKATTGEKLLRAVGTFGFDLGTDSGNKRIMGATIGGLGGLAGAGLTGGIVAPVIGTTSQQLYKLLGRGKAEKVLKIIEKR